MFFNSSSLFYFLLFLLVYTYFAYPALLLMSAMIRGARKPIIETAAPSTGSEAALPAAAIIIPAYNEEIGIRSKLENVLQLNCPGLEIIVASDASTDKTDGIVREFAGHGVKLFRLEQRGGKIAAYKNAVRHANGEILVFSDATSQLEKDSLQMMLRNFADPTVGCVAGRLFFVAQTRGGIGKGEETYWNYNIRINEAESRLASLTSVSGTFFAVRKNIFPLDMPDDLAEDLIVPLNVVRRGYRTVLEPAAVCREASVHAETQEIRKRARITLQNIRGLVYGWDLLNVFKFGFFSVLLISHKVLRILTPMMLAILFASTFALSRSSEFFKLLLVMQAFFYCLGFLSSFWRENRPRSVNVVHFFCLSNYAIFVGILMYLRGDKLATWETERV